jgi:DNA-binding beta-propeller fold protein YncE
VDPHWPQRPADKPWGQMPGIAVDCRDQVWILTRADPTVHVYDGHGKFQRAWGAEVFGPAYSTLKAHHIKLDRQGMLWLADVGNHVIWQVSPAGKVLKTLGTCGQAGCDATHLDKPTDMAVTPQGEIFVSDGYGNARVVHFDAQGRFVKAWGRLGTAPGEFSLVHAIVSDSQGRLYVADRNNARIQVFAQDGKFLDQWTNLIVPWGLWITPQDEIWVCGCSPMGWRATDDCLSCPPKDQIFMKFDTTGRARQLWTVPKGADGKEEPGDLNWVHGVAVDSQGNIYAGDIVGKRAQKFVRH